MRTYLPWKKLRCRRRVGVRRCTVPRIPDGTLASVIYLYPSSAHAERGERMGGSGFIVAVQSATINDPYRKHVYAVTNRHVIRDGQSPVIRLNTWEGSFDILDLSPLNWSNHPEGDDIAIAPLSLDRGIHRAWWVDSERLVTKEHMKAWDFGPGSDVMMVGRFAQHEGEQQNRPTARFGNIAMQGWDPIFDSNRRPQDSILVEVRSIPGYSGSPVFVALEQSKRTEEYEWERESKFLLLGIDWCHIPNYDQVQERGADGTWHAVPNLRARSNTGMMGVVPAWKLKELLDSPEFMNARSAKDREWLAERSGQSFGADDATSGAISQQSNDSSTTGSTNRQGEAEANGSPS